MNNKEYYLKELETRVNDLSDQAINKTSFDMVGIKKDLPQKVKKQLAEFNRLILFSMNYGASKNEILDSRDGVLESIKNLFINI